MSGGLFRPRGNRVAHGDLPNDGGYDRMREAYEEGPSKKTGGYESRRIAEKVAPAKLPPPIDLESELTQQSTLPPDEPKDKA